MKSFLNRKNVIAMFKFCSYVALLQTLFATMAFSNSGFGQDRMKTPISCQWSNIPLVEAFADIQSQTDLFFTHVYETVENIKISNHNSEFTVIDILKHISAESGLHFKVSDNIIYVLDGSYTPRSKISIRLPATKPLINDLRYINYNVVYELPIQGKGVDVIIKGKVTSNRGEPLIGATILEKNSGQGTVTDVNGQFAIALDKSKPNILIFSYIGYETKEISLDQETELNVSLSPQANELNEIVVTALNLKNSKNNLGYSVEQLKGESVSTIKNTNIKSSLLGKVAGVNVSPVRNGIGGSQRVIIRGVSSISRDNQPLWVIDGVPIYSNSFGNTSAGGGVDYGDPLSGMDPDNIESISVLKGNAAAALYGSRAANGVILVTTKSGQSQEGVTLDFSSTFNIDQPVDFSNWQYEYGQGSEGNIPQSIDQAFAWGASNWGAKINGQQGYQFDGQQHPYKAYPNNFKNYYQPALTGIYALGISGNANDHHYRISLSRQDSKDVIPNATYNRNTIGINAGSSFKKLDIQLRLHYLNENGANRSRVGGNYSNPHYGLFSIPVSVDLESLKPGYDEDGNEITFANHRAKTNPFFIANKIKQEDSKNHFIGALSATLPITHGLYLKGRVMQDYLSFRNRFATSKGIAWNPGGGGLEEQWTTSIQSNYETILGFENNISHLKLDFFAGGNVLAITNRGVSISGNPFATPDIYSINNLQTRKVSSSFSEEKTISMFGSFQFGWKNIAFLTLTGRNDWFSTLPKDNNHLFYPSVSFSLIPREWFHHDGFITFNQIRISMARVSGSTSPYQLDIGYSLDALSYNGNSLQKVSSSKIPNKLLQPFLSTELEYGINLGIFKSKWLFDATYYDKNIVNDIVSSTVSPTTGYNSAVLNVGEISNKGIELSLSGTLIDVNDITLNFSTNFSFNKNKVESLGNSLSTISLVRAKYSNSAYIHIDEGEALGTIRGTTFLKDEHGTLVYDEKGYPVVNSQSTILGYSIYDKLAGLSLNFSYKNLSLFASIDGKFGADIFSESYKNAIVEGKHVMTLEGRENGLAISGVDTDGNALNVNIPAQDIEYYYQRYGLVDEPHVHSADFVKFRELAIGFSFPKKYLKSKIASAEIQLIGGNLFYLFKNTNSFDPESSLTSSDVQGFETFGYPSTRRFGINLNLKF